MSNTTTPISATQFAHALESLPVENLYAKALEIRNSIAHLQRSNLQLQQYSDSIAGDTSIGADVRIQGDKECLDAIRENDVVIERQRQRVGLLKSEVVRRGGRWHEMDPGDGSGDGNGFQGEDGNGVEDGVEDRAVDGEANATTTTATAFSGRDASRVQPGGRLTDEDLRTQLAERMEEDHEEGMHL